MMKKNIAQCLLKSITLPVLILCLSSVAEAQAPQGYRIEVNSATKSDITSQPLSSFEISAPRGRATPREAERVRRIRPLTRGRRSPSIPDPSIQSDAGSPTTITIESNFDGVGDGTPSSNPGLKPYQTIMAPPDMNGAPGTTQYVQWVNTAFAVFDKKTGKLLYGPAEGKTIWRGFGGLCERDNDGDPIVLFDKAAGRWILAQFAVSNTTKAFYQCIAVSTSNDALGTYRRYAFKYAGFDDFPKMGVWTDAYYTTFNMFEGSSDAFLGAKVCAYDREAMLGLLDKPNKPGRQVTQQCVQLKPAHGGLLPADVDGPTLPPAKAPNYLLSLATNTVNLWKFSVNWQRPAESSFTGPINLPVNEYDEACNGAACVPQPGTNQKLDTLADRLMYRLAYRRFPDHESLVFNHSVSVNGGTSAIRWYELRDPGGSPTITQQGTFAPDSNHRWMGGVAMDKTGNIGVAYNISSPSMQPSINLSGHEATDPPGKLQAETTIIKGSGSQRCVLPNGDCDCKTVNGSCVTTNLSRWGDYTGITVDPVDDCTFWYTTEYLKKDAGFVWSTRIVSFRFNSCR